MSARPAVARDADKEALSKGVSRVVNSGAPAGNLVATVGALKAHKDLGVELNGAKREPRVLRIPALRPDPDIDCALTRTRD